MERCPACKLQNKRKNKYNHELTDTHLAANYQYYCKQCKSLISLADKRSHLQSNEHKNRRMWFCEVCKKDININTKSSHMKCRSHIENENFRINKNLTDKIHTYINPDFEQVDNLVIDDCKQHFHRFKNKCGFVVKFNHATHRTTK